MTKPNHPWTNRQVERMNRTIKDATVKPYFYDTHNQLKAHWNDFLRAYNFARRLKTLKGLTPYEYRCKLWTQTPHKFTLDPIHQMPGLNIPLIFRITGGQAGEYAPAAELLHGQKAEAVLADRGYDSDAIVAQSKDLGAAAVIPPKRNRKQARVYDRELYKQRNRIERCFNKLKHFRRFATRYCKTIHAFRPFTALPCAWLRLMLYVDTP